MKTFKAQVVVGEEGMSLGPNLYVSFDRLLEVCHPVVPLRPVEPGDTERLVEPESSEFSDVPFNRRVLTAWVEEAREASKQPDSEWMEEASINLLKHALRRSVAGAQVCVVASNQHQADRLQEKMDAIKQDFRNQGFGEELDAARIVFFYPLNFAERVKFQSSVVGGYRYDEVVWHPSAVLTWRNRDLDFMHDKNKKADGLEEEGPEGVRWG